VDEQTPEHALDYVLGKNWCLDLNALALVKWTAAELGLWVRWIAQNGLYATLVGGHAIANWLKLTRKLPDSRVIF
jgi:hypothetical protein